MPTPPLEEETQKITINIWKSDYLALQIYGKGWSSKVRDIIRQHVKEKMMGGMLDGRR